MNTNTYTYTQDVNSANNTNALELLSSIEKQFT